MASAASRYADPCATRAPSALLALTELPRALFELGSLPFASPLLASAPRGDGHSVLVLPGFTTTDASTAVLRRYLTGRGYDACTWDLGRNLGPRAIGRATQLTHPESRRIGPEKGVIHIALGAVNNALWDMYARSRDKPLWKLVVDMTPVRPFCFMSYSTGSLMTRLTGRARELCCFPLYHRRYH